MIFRSPKTMEELRTALENRGESCLLAAGCTDILPRKLGKPWNADEIIDLTHVPELKQIRCPRFLVHDGSTGTTDSSEFFIGACCTHAQIAENKTIDRFFSALAQACSQVGSAQIRNRGTIGGNVMNGSPAADTLPCLMLFGAEMQMLENCVTGFWVPMPEEGTISAFAKLGDRDIVTIARIDLAVKTVLQDGRMSKTGVVLGAAGEQPFFCGEAAKVLDGSAPQDADREAFAAALSEAVRRSIPERSTMPYKAKAVYGPAFDVLERLARTQPAFGE